MNENLTYQAFIDNILQTRGRFNCGDEYHERHHIVPKCLGGTNDEDNLIDLFAREHYVAHELLAKENPHNQTLNFVWALMSSRIENKTGEKCIKSAEEYEVAKKALSEFLSVNRKGKKFTDEHKNNLSKALKGRVFTEEWKENIRKNHYHGTHPMKGKHHSEESKKNMSIAAQIEVNNGENDSLKHKGVRDIPMNGKRRCLKEILEKIIRTMATINCGGKEVLHRCP